MRRLATSLLLLAPLVATAGGPWPQRKGGAYVKLSSWNLRYDQHYTDLGRLDPNITSGNHSVFLYGEYGFTDRLTGVLNAAVFARATQNELASATTREVITPGEAVNGLGDVDVAAKYALTAPGAKWPVAVTLQLGLPTGISAGGAEGDLQTGDGEFNQLLRVDAGRGFRLPGGTAAYSSAYAGFNNRTGGFSDEWRAGLELGAGLFAERLWLVGRLDVVESLKNGEPAAFSQRTGIFANNAEFVSVGVEANAYLGERFGLSAGVASAVRGEVIAAGTSYAFGVFYDLK